MTPRFKFDCPACVVETAVDAGVRTEILAHGCVICETAIGPAAFHRLPDGEQ